MGDVIRIFIAAIALTGLLLYVISVYFAGHYSRQGAPHKMPALLIEAITLLGAAFAANFGATLGIDLPSELQVDAQVQPDSSLTLGQWMRLSAAAVYFGSLLLALWFWWRTGWETDPAKIVRTVPEQSRMLLGIVVGAIAVAFTL